jgi:hypothetical protein
VVVTQRVDRCGLGMVSWEEGKQRRDGEDTFQAVEATDGCDEKCVIPVWDPPCVNSGS